MKVSIINFNSGNLFSIKKSIKDIMSDSSGYDPLVHLDDAKQRGVDLTEFFNK